MSKINKKSIILNILVVAALALSAMALIPKEASAQNDGRYRGYVNPKKVNVDRPSVSSNDPTSGVYVSNANEYLSYYVPTTTTVKTASASTAKKASSTAGEKETFSSLAANVLFGDGSFMPSSLIQWMLFSILILFGIILVRKTFGAEKAYHATPLKHD